MDCSSFKRLARGGLAAAAIVATGAVLAGQLATNVAVKVRLISSSGACGAASSARVEVSCQRPGGPLLPDAGEVPYRRVGMIWSEGVVAEPLPIYSDGTKVTSWRVVTLDNGQYVELTIAW